MARQGKKPTLRGKNLTDADIELVVGILDGWSGKLTWELLQDAVAARIFCRYTRQTLHKHERIRLAFALRKAALSDERGDGEISGPPELVAAKERIARLEAENQRLEAENRRLLEQFVRWAYNAHTRGLGKDFLSRPLPRVSRGQTQLVQDRKR